MKCGQVHKENSKIRFPTPWTKVFPTSCVWSSRTGTPGQVSYYLAAHWTLERHHGWWALCWAPLVHHSHKYRWPMNSGVVMDSLGHVTATRHQKMRCVHRFPFRTKALTPQGLGVLSSKLWLVIAKYLLPYCPWLKTISSPRSTVLSQGQLASDSIWHHSTGLG